MQQNTLISQGNNQAGAANTVQATPAAISNVSNAVLNRLINEVRAESQNNVSAYNRTHNRHNRGK